MSRISFTEHSLLYEPALECKWQSCSYTADYLRNLPAECEKFHEARDAISPREGPLASTDREDGRAVQSCNAFGLGRALGY